MASKSLRHVLKRIDIDLEKQIKEYSIKNNIGFREASREIANKLSKIKNVKIKEIKI